jgi:hypothetical protein
VETVSMAKNKVSLTALKQIKKLVDSALLKEEQNKKGKKNKKESKKGKK